jgi:hypothetical protein
LKGLTAPVPGQLAGSSKKIIFVLMRPDYDHKLFNDKRMGYCLLMEALAMGSL